MQYVKIGEIKVNSRNPRKINSNSVKRLMTKINRNPFLLESRPLLVREKDGVILGGNQRYKACKDLGWDEIPVAYMTKELFDKTNKHRESKGLKPYKNMKEWEDDVMLVDNLHEGSDDFEILAEEFDKEFLIDMGFLLPDEFDEHKVMKDIPDTAEVEFSDELLLEHNYVVLYFDNPMDWQVAQDKLGLKKVKSGIPTEKSQKVGVGRVINGMDIIQRL